jgi:hypothetical protein
MPSSEMEQTGGPEPWKLHNKSYLNNEIKELILASEAGTGVGPCYAELNSVSFCKMDNRVYSLTNNSKFKNFVTTMKSKTK